MFTYDLQIRTDLDNVVYLTVIMLFKTIWFVADYNNIITIYFITKLLVINVKISLYSLVTY